MSEQCIFLWPSSWRDNSYSRWVQGSLYSVCPKHTHSTKFISCPSFPALREKKLVLLSWLVGALPTMLWALDFSSYCEWTASLSGYVLFPPKHVSQMKKKLSLDSHNKCDSQGVQEMKPLNTRTWSMCTTSNLAFWHPILFLFIIQEDQLVPILNKKTQPLSLQVWSGGETLSFVIKQMCLCYSLTLYIISFKNLGNLFTLWISIFHMCDMGKYCSYIV